MKDFTILLDKGLIGMKTMNIDQIDKIKLHFIMGIGRSGTTLLQTMLDSHPHVIAPFEFPFILFYYPTFFNKKIISTEDIHQFYNALFYKRAIHIGSWLVDKDKLFADLLALKNNATIERMIKVVYLNYLSTMKENTKPIDTIKILVDKNPDYNLYIHIFRNCFPTAKFIILVRDPRDNYLSRIKNHSGYTQIRAVAACTYPIFYKILNRNAQIEPNRFLTIKYEDLVIDPAATLKIICAHLEIGYNDQMMEYQQKSKLLFNKQIIKSQKEEAKVKSMHKNLLKSPIKDNINSWKSQMNERELKMVDYLSGRYAKEVYSYPLGTVFTKRDYFMLFFLYLPARLFAFILYKSHKTKPYRPWWYKVAYFEKWTKKPNDD